MMRQLMSFLLLAAVPAICQESGDRKQALQQRIVEVKQSIAQNQAQLQKYSWVETTEISLKGEIKKRDQKDCSYGPDGEIRKVPVSAPAPAKHQRGLKGRIIENKVDDMKEYMDRVGSLIHRYVPPDPQAMQAAFQSGKAALQPAGSSGPGSLVFRDYAKQGDTVTFTFDATTRTLRSFRVDTYLDAPQDVVRLDASFSSLSDGTNFLEQTVLDAQAKSIRVKTTNFGHRKAGS
ncbi:MAG: hypothetical protein ACRD7E_01785 [Bryobacteraceae bacterium]